jgi:hypothetical protein
MNKMLLTWHRVLLLCRMFLNLILGLKYPFMPKPGFGRKAIFLQIYCISRKSQLFFCTSIPILFIYLFYLKSHGLFMSIIGAF